MAMRVYPPLVVFIVLYLLLTVFGRINGQSTTAACTTVTDYNCTTSLNCTSIVCQIPDNATSFPSATASISLQPCDDPSMITFQLQGQNVSYTYVFEESDEVHIGSTTVRATVGRNSTALAFSAYVLPTHQNLIPPIIFPINTTECLCTSLEQLAEKIHTPFEHDCYTTTDCDGIICTLDVAISSYLLEMIVLSCEDPPAVDIVVEREDGTPIFSLVVNESVTVPVWISVFRHDLSISVIHRTYSMDVQVNLTGQLFGTINLVPRHTIILDPSVCHDPPPSPIPTTPPLPTLPPTAPELCATLYSMTYNTAPSLRCMVADSCTGFECDLELGEDVYYYINLRLMPLENDIKALLYTYGDSQQWNVTTGNNAIEIELSSSQGMSLVIITNTTTNILTLMMILRQSGQQDNVLVLIPTTTIYLPSAEGCLWWIPAITDKIDCSYLLDCQGIQCQQYYGYIKTASINLEYCADPITVELDLISIYDDDSFQDNFTQSETFLNSNGYNAISIERNDMQLMISVFSYDYDIVYFIVPPLTIPLNPHMCSCQSLEELAEKTQSPLEHDCYTNEACDGIRCELDVFGTRFHLETILLSCDTPPALESVVEDENNVPLHTAVYSTSGEYLLEIEGIFLPVYVNIQHHNYSMDVEATLYTIIFGNITIIPRHTLYLDRTNCPSPPTVPPTFTQPPPPTNIPPSVSPTCRALIDIAMESAQEPFICSVPSLSDDSANCDRVICKLGLIASTYDLILEVYPQGGDYVGSVTVESEDVILEAVQVKKFHSFDVVLQEGKLHFNFETHDGSLEIMVSITVNGGRTITLIDATVPLEDGGESHKSKSTDTSPGVIIGVPIVAVLLLIIILSVLVVVMVLVIRWKQRQRQFDFKPMTYSDLQENENNDEVTMTYSDLQENENNDEVTSKEEGDSGSQQGSWEQV